MDKFIDWVLKHPYLYALASFILILALNYFLALAGNPNSLWLMRDILGII